MTRKFRLGLIVNPFSGIGGALALKGSDGAEIREKALSMGAIPQSNARMELALKEIVHLRHQLVIYVADAQMGATLVEKMGFDYRIIYHSKHAQTEPEDTIDAVRKMAEVDIDLLLFAGGDGTARNVVDSITGSYPVIGVPAGCKIHSGVYAITPSAAGRVLEKVIKGELLNLMQAEVKDINEHEFRKGNVVAKYYGELNVPQELTYIQAVKVGGRESDELVLQDIAAEVIETMQDNPETFYIMGSGSTVDFIMSELSLPNTLLGIDVVKNQTLIASDLTADQLINLVSGKASKLVITPIGGQGHIFGRGNQQLSSRFLTMIEKDDCLLVATKNKLNGLNGKPLVVDTGSPELDKKWSGLAVVITGYRDRSLYPVGYAKLDEITNDVSAQLNEFVEDRANHFDRFITHGNDQELFIASYLHGHFDLAVASLNIENCETLSEIKIALKERLLVQLSHAFSKGELESRDQQEVYSLLEKMFS